MRVLAILSLFALMSGVAFITPSAEGQASSKTPATPTDPIGRKRLSDAYGHTKNAAALAREGVAHSKDQLAKDAAALSEAQLRREIGLAADAAKANFSRVKTGTMQLDIATHLHLASVRLTTDRTLTFEQARDNIVKAKQQGNLDSHVGAIQRTVDAIHAALKKN